MLNPLEGRSRTYFVQGLSPWSKNCKPDSEQLLGKLLDETFNSIVGMVDPITGLPGDGTDGEQRNRTTVSNIAAFLTVLALSEKHLLPREHKNLMIGRVLDFLENAPNVDGLLPNWWSTVTGKPLTVWPESGEAFPPFTSAVDMANLALSLMTVRELVPEFDEAADGLLKRINLGRFYDERAGLMKGSLPLSMVRNRSGLLTLEIDEEAPFYHNGTMFTETAGASWLGINEGQLPFSHALILALSQYMLQQKKEGVVGEHLLTWGGSAFEAYLLLHYMNGGTLHPVFAQSAKHLAEGQINHGASSNNGLGGLAGWSPCPYSYFIDGRRVVGYDELGHPEAALYGYSHGVTPTFNGEARGDEIGVVTPHAFLQFLKDYPDYTVGAVMETNRRYPFRGLGLPASVTSTGELYPGQIMWDQFLSFLPLYRYFHGDKLSKVLEPSFSRLGKQFRHINPLDQEAVIKELRRYVPVNVQPSLDMWLVITKRPVQEVNGDLDPLYMQIAGAVARNDRRQGVVYQTNG